MKLVRSIPLLRLVAIAQLALVAKKHVDNLTPAERRRLVRLLRRPHKLTPKQRKDLRKLVAKLEPRAFAGSAVQRFSPVPLPRRLTHARY
jgi:hypothetical protein